jgi:diacylglycerol kinase family enzyme
VPSPITIILNESAGSAGPEAIRNKIDSLFFTSGVATRIHVADQGARIEELARQALREGSCAVVAGGGDGTLNSVAGVLADTGTHFGVLPLGTLNHFAKDAGVPLAIEEAVRAIIHGATMPVDAGEVNGRIFLNNSSLGIYPQLVVIRKQHERRGASRWGGILRATWKGLLDYDLLAVRLNADGSELARRTPFVFVGNNRYQFEGLNLGSRKSLNEGCLSLAVAHRTGRAGLVRLAFHALRGRLREAHDFDLLTAESVTVETPQPSLRVALDGEVFEIQPPLRYRIRRGALQLIVPPGRRALSGS